MSGRSVQVSPFLQRPPEIPHTSLEGTAQTRLAIPLVVTDGPVAAFGGLFGAVTPGTQLVSTALTVSGTLLQRSEKNTRPRHLLVYKPVQHGVLLHPTQTNQRWLIPHLRGRGRPKVSRALVETKGAIGGKCDFWYKKGQTPGKSFPLRPRLYKEHLCIFGASIS